MNGEVTGFVCGTDLCVDGEPHDSKTDREAVHANYRTYFERRVETDPEFKRRVLELRGKTLGCFCKPGRCHGDVIVEWIEAHS